MVESKHIYYAALFCLISMNSVLGQADSTVTIHYTDPFGMALGIIIFQDKSMIHIDRGSIGVLILRQKRVVSIEKDGKDVTRQYLSEYEKWRRIRPFVIGVGGAVIVPYLIVLYLLKTRLYA